VTDGSEEKAPPKGAPSDLELLRRAWPWLSKNPVAAVTLLGLAVYGVQRFGADLFLGRLGFSPDDVGLSYSTSISEAVLAALLFAFFFVVIPIALGLLLMLVSLLRSAALKLARDERHRGAWARARGRVSKTSRSAFRDVIGFIIVVVLVTSPFEGWLSARDATAGHPAYSTFGVWSAVASRVHLLQPTVGLTDGQCMLYLGEADGFVALYDPAEGQSWRVPVSVVAVETGGALDEVETVPDDC
jgi:hypothetical protein